jgi:hypothetical protein
MIRTRILRKVDLHHEGKRYPKRPTDQSRPVGDLAGSGRNGAIESTQTRYKRGLQRNAPPLHVRGLPGILFGVSQSDRSRRHAGCPQPGRDCHGTDAQIIGSLKGEPMGTSLHLFIALFQTPRFHGAPSISTWTIFRIAVSQPFYDLTRELQGGIPARHRLFSPRPLL